MIKFVVEIVIDVSFITLRCFPETTQMGNLFYEHSLSDTIAKTSDSITFVIDVSFISLCGFPETTKVISTQP